MSDGDGWVDRIDTAIVEERFLAATGPGGQNVNKVATAVQLRVNVFALGLDILVGYAGLISLGHAGLFGIAAYTVAILLEHGLSHSVAIIAALGMRSLSCPS